MANYLPEPGPEGAFAALRRRPPARRIQRTKGQMAAFSAIRRNGSGTAFSSAFPKREAGFSFFYPTQNGKERKEAPRSEKCSVFSVK